VAAEVGEQVAVFEAELRDAALGIWFGSSVASVLVAGAEDAVAVEVVVVGSVHHYPR